MKPLEKKSVGKKEEEHALGLVEQKSLQERQKSQVPGGPRQRGGGQAVNTGTAIASEHGVGRRSL